MNQSRKIFDSKMYLGPNCFFHEPSMPDKSAFLFIQLDAERDEEEVFYDISLTVDNKLYPTKEPVAGNGIELLLHFF